MAKFVHLHNHSHYSLLDALPKIDEMINHAKSLGMEALALTDHGNLYGALEFYKKSKKAGLKPILGCEIYVAPRGRQDKTHGVDNKYFHLTLLCENNIGWKNLIKLVTRANLEGFYYKPRADKELVRQYSGGLIALSGCYSGELIRSILLGRLADSEKIIEEHINIFGRNNYYIEIQHHPEIDPTNHQRINETLVSLARKYQLPLVATQDVHYLKKDDAPYHDVLLSVQASVGGKRSYGDDFSMRSPEQMLECFKDWPEALESTAKIAERCNVAIELGKTVLPKFPLPEGETAVSHLHNLVYEQAPRRYKQVTPKIKERIDFELNVIEKMGYPAYFLIVQDFIKWARDRGVVVGPGRGSAAGSIVSYIIGVTNLDPLEHGLLFERFLNPDRVQMPDIDVDIADARRDEVVGYLREKYGADRVANIITFGTMAARAAIRDAGRSMGMSYDFCDQIAKLIPFNAKLAEALEEVPELKKIRDENQDAKKLLTAAGRLEGVARHASVHACGIVIGDQPLTEYIPLQFAPQDETVIVTQFEMHAIEDMGLLKMDLLGLKNLTIMEGAVRLIKERDKGEINIDNLPPKDSKTFEMLQRGETTGVFQFESAGMRRFMKDLKPTALDDLTALVALYRPGPIELIPSYIKRKHGEEPVSYLHEKLEPIMRPTYGIGVYQEQMMRISRDLAGYTLAEADTLRKAIGKKIKELLDEQKIKLIGGMKANGISEATAKAIWELFPPFARYGFNKSHAACYALIAYQTAYLRANFTVEFMTSLLNADTGDIERVAFLVNDCKKIGILVLPPDINASFENFEPDENNIRFGMLAIKNVGNNIVAAIIEERGRGGPYKKLSDLMLRVRHKDLNKKSLESMIKCGVFDSVGLERNMAIENIDEILKFGYLARKHQESNQGGLFGGEFFGQLNLKPAAMADLKTKLAWEKELLGLYVSDHPLNSYKKQMADLKPIKEALTIKNEQLFFAIGGMITSVKKIMTKENKPMCFAKIEDFNEAIEVVVFPRAIDGNRFYWEEGKAVRVRGKMSWRNNEPKLICDTVREL